MHNEFFLGNVQAVIEAIVLLQVSSVSNIRPYENGSVLTQIIKMCSIVLCNAKKNVLHKSMVSAVNHYDIWLYTEIIVLFQLTTFILITLYNH